MYAYRRKEPFRYTFDRDIRGFLKILSVDGIRMESITENIYLLDLSPNGMRIKSDIDLSIQKKSYKMEISFILNKKEIVCVGSPIWKKQVGPYSFYYGIKGYNNEKTKKEIIEELKIYARKGLKENKNPQTPYRRTHFP